MTEAFAGATMPPATRTNRSVATAAFVCGLAVATALILAAPTSPWPPILLGVGALVALAALGDRLEPNLALGAIALAYLVWFVARPLAYPAFLGAGDLPFHETFLRRVIDNGFVPTDAAHQYDNWPGFYLAGAWFVLLAGVSAPVAIHVVVAAGITAGSVLVVGLARTLLKVDSILVAGVLLIAMLGNRFVAYHAAYSAPRCLAFGLFLGLFTVLAIEWSTTSLVLVVLLGFATVFSHSVIELQSVALWGFFVLALGLTRLRTPLLILSLAALTNFLYQGDFLFAQVLTKLSQSYRADSIASSAQTVSVPFITLVAENLDTAILLLIFAVLGFLWLRKAIKAPVLALGLLMVIYVPSPLTRETGFAAGLQLWRWNIVAAPLVVLLSLGFLLAYVVPRSRRTTILVVALVAFYVAASVVNPLITPAGADITWPGTTKDSLSEAELAGAAFVKTHPLWVDPSYAKTIQQRYVDVATDYTFYRQISDTEGPPLDVSGSMIEDVCSTGAYALLRSEILDHGVKTYPPEPPRFMRITPEAYDAASEGHAVAFDSGAVRLLSCR